MKLLMLQDHFEIVKKINQYWKTDVLMRLLQSIAKQSNQQTAAFWLSENTRWQDKLNILNLNISNKIYMQQAILKKNCLSEKSDAETTKKYKRMREMILNEKYWMKTLKLQTFLKSFLQVTLTLESNKSKFSCFYVYYIWFLNQSVLFLILLLLSFSISDMIELICK